MPPSDVPPLPPESPAPPRASGRRWRLRRPRWLITLGTRVGESAARMRCTWEFVGQVLQGLGRLCLGRSSMRLADLIYQIDQAGPRSVAIVSLVSGLVGIILAYMGAVQLQRFGAQTYIADLVSIGSVREVAALMTGIILSGRVGAAYAAQLASMQANEEIDALKAMGVDPIDHLVLPRVLALWLVAPLLTAYAAIVAVAAGWLVAVAVFGVAPTEYLYRSGQVLTLAHVSVGLSKGTVYCLLVALAGCRQGLNAGRSAEAVGQAVTRSVVQAIVWIVVAASMLTIALQRLGW